LSKTHLFKKEKKKKEKKEKKREKREEFYLEQSYY
jgi:hypothetical protein